MASRDPKDLSDDMYFRWSEWDKVMKSNEIDYILTCTVRTLDEQKALYAQGRSKPGKIVTWTLNSKHLTGDAFDFCIMNNGKCDWSMLNKEDWETAVEIGKSLGLSQVVDNKGRIKEYAHLQRG
ncbi:MAG: M15 family metallopeptidase [Candidatus Omnitrophica bacterium]|nr:M15 family metallopeptidase [Candidatus Omnitrophota bacterium]